MVRDKGRCEALRVWVALTCKAAVSWPQTIPFSGLLAFKIYAKLCRKYTSKYTSAKYVAILLQRSLDKSHSLKDLFLLKPPACNLHPNGQAMHVRRRIVIIASLCDRVQLWIHVLAEVRRQGVQFLINGCHRKDSGGVIQLCHGEPESICIYSSHILTTLKRNT